MAKYNSQLINTLINDFNVINYGADISTNLTFDKERNELVIRFGCDQSSAQKYLLKMTEQLTGKYFQKDRAGDHFNLQHFPFNVAQGEFRHNNDGTCEFAVPMNGEVFTNLKEYSAHGMMRNIDTILRRQVKMHMRSLGHSETVVNEKADLSSKLVQAIALKRPSPYLIALRFQENPDINWKKIVIAVMNHLELTSHWVEENQNDLYLRNNNDIDFYHTTAKLTQDRVGHVFEDPSAQDTKIENYKNALADLIFSLTGVSMDSFVRDRFLNNKDGYIALIPTIDKEDGTQRYSTSEEVQKINKAFQYLGCGDVISNIEGDTEITRGKKNGGTYGFSNKQLAYLLPVFMRNSFMKEKEEFVIDSSLMCERKLYPEQFKNVPYIVDPANITLEFSDEKNINIINERKNERKIEPSTSAAGNSHSTLDKPSCGNILTISHNNSENSRAASPSTDSGCPLFENECNNHGGSVHSLNRAPLSSEVTYKEKDRKNIKGKENTDTVISEGSKKKPASDLQVDSANEIKGERKRSRCVII